MFKIKESNYGTPVKEKATAKDYGDFQVVFVMPSMSDAKSFIDDVQLLDQSEVADLAKDALIGVKNLKTDAENSYTGEKDDGDWVENKELILSDPRLSIAISAAYSNMIANSVISKDKKRKN